MSIEEGLNYNRFFSQLARQLFALLISPFLTYADGHCQYWIRLRTSAAAYEGLRGRQQRYIGGKNYYRYSGYFLLVNVSYIRYNVYVYSYNVYNTIV